VRSSWIAAIVLAGCANASAVPRDAGPGGDAAPPDAPAVTGHRATGVVAGGVVSTSPHYKLVGSTSAHAGMASSPGYRLHTGVVGGSQ
jgi:hypothetical protein